MFNFLYLEPNTVHFIFGVILFLLYCEMKNLRLEDILLQIPFWSKTKEMQEMFLANMLV